MCLTLSLPSWYLFSTCLLAPSLYSSCHFFFLSARLQPNSAHPQLTQVYLVNVVILPVICHSPAQARFHCPPSHTFCYAVIQFTSTVIINFTLQCYCSVLNHQLLFLKTYRKQKTVYYIYLTYHFWCSSCRFEFMVLFPFSQKDIL